MNEPVEQQIQDLRLQVAEIQQRNARVEADKLWETSLTRKLLILATTYTLMVCTFFALGASAPFLQALVPSLGYFLSTLSLGPARWFLTKSWPASVPPKDKS